MREYLVVFGVALGVTYLLASIARMLAMRFGAVARVRDRDVHAIPTPYFGGPAMLGGLVAAYLTATHLPFLALSEDAVFAIGPYTFKPAAKLLLDNEKRKKVRLTEKETSILKYLFRAGDRAVSRDVLLNEVWGYNAGVTTHTLETHVYRLRQKIEPDPANARLLLTEQGGYKLAP